MVLLAVLLCTLLRGSKLQESKVCCAVCAAGWLAGARERMPASSVRPQLYLTLLALLLPPPLLARCPGLLQRAAIMLLFRCALLCDEQVRLQTVVPYLLTQLSDPSASVR